MIFKFKMAKWLLMHPVYDYDYQLVSSIFDSRRHWTNGKRIFGLFVTGYEQRKRCVENRQCFVTITQKVNKYVGWEGYIFGVVCLTFRSMKYKTRMQAVLLSFFLRIFFPLWRFVCPNSCTDAMEMESRRI